MLGLKLIQVSKWVPDQLVPFSGTIQLHGDVIKWKHFPRNWPFVQRIHRSPVNSPHKGQWRGALIFSLICVWINDWVNNREAGDLRHYRAHYDVIAMYLNQCSLMSYNPRGHGLYISIYRIAWATRNCFWATIFPVPLVPGWSCVLDIIYQAKMVAAMQCFLCGSAAGFNNNWGGKANNKTSLHWPFVPWIDQTSGNASHEN